MDSGEGMDAFSFAAATALACFAGSGVRAGAAAAALSPAPHALAAIGFVSVCGEKALAAAEREENDGVADPDPALRGAAPPCEPPPAPPRVCANNSSSGANRAAFTMR